jgi:hypothetical protein
MTDVCIAPVLAPILGRFGGNQLITAYNAFHPEAGSTIGYYLPHTQPAFASNEREKVVSMPVDFAAIRLDLDQKIRASMIG